MPANAVVAPKYELLWTVLIAEIAPMPARFIKVKVLNRGEKMSITKPEIAPVATFIAVVAYVRAPCEKS